MNEMGLKKYVSIFFKKKSDSYGEFQKLMGESAKFLLIQGLYQIGDIIERMEKEQGIFEKKQDYGLIKDTSKELYQKVQNYRKKYPNIDMYEEGLGFLEKLCEKYLNLKSD